MEQVQRRTQRLSAAAVGVVATSLALTACASSGGKSAGGPSTGSTSNQPPKQAVATAVGALGKQSSLQMTFSIPLSQAQLEQIKDSSGTAPNPSDAKALSTGSIFITEATGHGEALDSTEAQSDAQNSVALGLSFGQDTPIELRYVGQNLYLHADASQLLSDVGQPTSEAAQFNSELTQINSYVPGISDLGQGKWVEVTQAGLQPLEAMLKQAEAAQGQTTPTTTPEIQAQVQKLRTELLAAVQANSTAAAIASSNGRDGYSLTVDVSGLVNTVVPELQSTFAAIPGFSSEATNELQQAKNALAAGQSAVIDVYVSSNKLSEADLDLNQFSKDLSSPLPLRLAFASPGAPTAPSGATQLDLSKLPNLLGGLMGSLGQGGTA